MLGGEGEKGRGRTIGGHEQQAKPYLVSSEFDLKQLSVECVVLCELHIVSHLSVKSLIWTFSLLGWCFAVVCSFCTGVNRETRQGKICM